jgi:hypothetical protein
MTSFRLLSILAVLACVAGCVSATRAEVSPPRAEDGGGTEDGGQCIDLVLLPGDLACTKSTDCGWVSTGKLCVGYAPNEFCSRGAANNAAAARIASQIASVPRGPPSAAGHCDGDEGTGCVQGQCVPCGSEGVPCADASP